MRPPSPTVPSTLVEQIIHAHQHEGISFAELQRTTAVWPDELARMIHELRDQRLIVGASPREAVSARAPPP